jgi:hypothetical protein
MDTLDRDARLRRRFGPPPDGRPPPSRRRRPRPRPSAIAAALAALAAASLVAVYFAATPRNHVAPGCWWWTATTVGAVLPGQRGCVRGYVGTGGELAEGTGAAEARLALASADPDQPTRRSACPFRPADAVVIRYHAVFDDGRTLIVIDDCR